MKGKSPGHSLGCGVQGGTIHTGTCSNR